MRPEKQDQYELHEAHFGGAIRAEMNGGEGKDAGAFFRNVGCGGRPQRECWTAAWRRKRSSAFTYGFPVIRDEHVTGTKERSVSHGRS